MENAHALQDRPERWDVLGGVRFGLAMVVLFAHLGLMTTVSPWLAHAALLSAPTAVFCFLVISGYSIAHSVGQNRKAFYRRRLVRVYPLYLLGIATAVAVGKLPGAKLPAAPHNVLANLFFLQTFCALPLPSNGCVWSLAVEVACYAMAPFFNRMSTSVLVMITAVSATAFALYPQYEVTYYAGLYHGRALLFLAWAWLAGFIYYRHRHSQPAGVILIATVIILTSLNTAFTQRLQHITVVVSIGLLVAGNSVQLRQQPRKFLAWLGNLSFPVYLMHAPIIMLCTDTLHWRSPVALVALAFSSSALALGIESKVRPVFERILIFLELTGARVATAGAWVANECVTTLVGENPLRSLGLLRQSLIRPISIALALLGYASYAVRHQPDHDRSAINLVEPTLARDTSKT